MEHTHNIALPALQATVNSTSVVDNAIVSWNLVLYTIVLPANQMIMPLIDFL